MNLNTNSPSNSREAEIRTYAQNGQSLRESDSNREFDRLSGELNQRITQEMEDFMSSVSSHIQRAVDEAISDQILPQIQATLRSGHGRMLERRWEVGKYLEIFGKRVTSKRIIQHYNKLQMNWPDYYFPKFSLE